MKPTTLLQVVAIVAGVLGGNEATAVGFPYAQTAILPYATYQTTIYKPVLQPQVLHVPNFYYHQTPLPFQPRIISQTPFLLQRHPSFVKYPASATVIQHPARPALVGVSPAPPGMPVGQPVQPPASIPQPGPPPPPGSGAAPAPPPSQPIGQPPARPSLPVGAGGQRPPQPPPPPPSEVASDPTDTVEIQNPEFRSARSFPAPKSSYPSYP